jgi:hypothetical protein
VVELSRLGLSVTEQTLRNWVALRGLPAGKDTRGVLCVKISDAVNYVNLHGRRRLEGRGHGGARAGAGRKGPASTTPALVPTSTPTPAPTTAPTATPTTAADPTRTAPGRLDARTLALAGVPESLAQRPLSELSLDELDKLERLAGATAKLLAAREAAGELLDAADVDATWGEALVDIRRAILAIPRRARDKIQAALSLTSTAAALAAQEVEKECLAVLKALEEGHD